MDLDTRLDPNLLPRRGTELDRCARRARRSVLALAVGGLLAVTGPGAVAGPYPAVRLVGAPPVGASYVTDVDVADPDAAVPDVDDRSAGRAAGWVLPLERGPGDLGVLAPFDPPEHDWLAGHRGVDLAASPGELVLSPAAGVVTFAGPVAGRAVLVVAHDDGLRTSLEPVVGSVEPGTRVGAGAAVGTVQDAAVDGVHGGHCAAVCVHWGVRRGERYVDPLALLGERPPVVLLPLG
jgi:murein DD-endopeptidase MepM/ murein hydrolase activator NlpD